MSRPFSELDRHRAGAGIENGREKASLTGSDDGGPGESRSGTDRLADGISAQRFDRRAVGRDDMLAPDVFRRDLDFGEVLAREKRPHGQRPGRRENRPCRGLLDDRRRRSGRGRLGGGRRLLGQGQQLLEVHRFVSHPLHGTDEGAHRERELALVFAQRQTIRLGRRDLQRRGEDFGPLDPLAALGRFGARPDLAVDGDDAHVLQDGPREYRLHPTLEPQLGGENHVHPIARIDQAGMSRPLSEPDRHSARTGLENGREEAPLARSDDRRPDERGTRGDGLAHRVAAQRVDRFRAVHREMGAPDLIFRQIERRQIVIGHQRAHRKPAGGHEDLAYLRLLGGAGGHLLRLRPTRLGTGSGHEEARRDHRRGKRHGHQEKQDDNRTVSLHRGRSPVLAPFRGRHGSARGTMTARLGGAIARAKGSSDRRRRAPA